MQSYITNSQIKEYFISKQVVKDKIKELDFRGIIGTQHLLAELGLE